MTLHDTALVLQGTQGLQKSKFWRTLAVCPDWFDDTITSGTNDKDERLKLRRFWILELAELESVFKRKEIAGLRAFFTTPVDTFKVGDEVEYIGAACPSLHGKKLVVSEVEGDVFWLKDASILDVVESTVIAG